MIEPAEFVRRWGAELVRAAPSAVQDLPVPEESRRFLVEAGLPPKSPWELSFTLGDRIPALPEAVPEAANRPDLATYRRIGQDTATHICLDLAREGRLMSVGLEPWREIPIRFVSTTVPQLAEMLLLSRDFRALRKELRERRAPQSEIDELVKSLRADLEGVDQEALADPENFFSLVLEQIEEQML